MLRCFLLGLLLCLAACSSAADPRARTIPHPDRPAATIEYFAEQPAGSGPWPTVVFLHGHQDAAKNIGGRAFADWGVLQRYAGKGYLAVSVSLPGYGNSTGPSDFAGPYTQHAVMAVIKRLEDEKLAVPDRILIQGTSLGAVTAALVSPHKPDLAGLVLISGLYDLPAFFARPKSAAALGVKAAAAAQGAGSEEALRSRSALFVADRIKADTLILNGARDERTSPTQARALAARINASGGKAAVIIYPDAGHEIPVAQRDAVIDAFIGEALGRR